MRTAETFRAARRNEVRGDGLSWRAQPHVRLSRNHDQIFVPTANAPWLIEPKAAKKAKEPFFPPGGKEALEKVAKAYRERLYGVAIAIPEGRLQMLRGSHAELRRRAGLEPDSHEDLCGFATTEGRFVSRREAKRIAIECGQLPEIWRNVSRDVLSSDVDWEGR